MNKFDGKDGCFALVNDKYEVINIIGNGEKSDTKERLPRTHKLIRCDNFVEVGDRYIPLENTFIKGCRSWI